MRSRIEQGDALTVLRKLPSNYIQTCVTSPPYFGLRDYGVDGQIGLEQTPDEFVAKLVDVFRDVRRVLRDDGTLWLNLGDSYASGTKGSGGAGKSTLGPNRDLQNIDFQKMEPRRFACGLADKQLLGIPWRVAFALQADGWYLRQDIIWYKPNPMPESVRDRCTKSHEYLFLLSKSVRYYFDAEAIKEPSSESSGWAKQRAKGVNTWKYNDTPARVAQTGQSVESSTLGEPGTRNKRSVWTVTTKPYKGAHFATFPADLITPCILAGAPEGGIVLDPFFGSGTTGAVAKQYGREYIGIELNPEYIKLAEQRLAAVLPPQPTLLAA